MLKKLNKNKYISSLLSVLERNKSVVLTVIVLSILTDIFFISGNSDIRTFGILGLSIVSISFYKLRSQLIFIFCLILLGIMFAAFLFSGTSIITEKVAVWFVLFFGVGIVRQWKE